MSRHMGNPREPFGTIVRNHTFFFFYQVHRQVLSPIKVTRLTNSVRSTVLENVGIYRCPRNAPPDVYGYEIDSPLRFYTCSTA